MAFIAFLLQAALYTWGIFYPSPSIWPATGFSAVCALILIGVCLEADRTPFSHGANDNASSVGLVLTLAESICTEPLSSSRMWLVCTGCEEVQHYGASEFFRRHREDLVNSKVVVFEMLGCEGPAWLEREGIVVPFLADQELVTLARRVAEENPHLGAVPARIYGGNSEMADALRVGIPAITIIGLDEKGNAPYWHQVEDRYENLDTRAMERNFAYIHQFIRSLDESAANADH